MVSGQVFALNQSIEEIYSALLRLAAADPIWQLSTNPFLLRQAASPFGNSLKPVAGGSWGPGSTASSKHPSANGTSPSGFCSCLFIVNFGVLILLYLELYLFLRGSDLFGGSSDSIF